MKKSKAVTLNLHLAKEMRRPRFATAFQKELSRNRLAEQIAALRQKQGWTQAELARKVGTTQSGIARLENPNYQNYSLKALEKNCRGAERSTYRGPRRISKKRGLRRSRVG